MNAIEWTVNQVAHMKAVEHEAYVRQYTQRTPRKPRIAPETLAHIENLLREGELSMNAIARRLGCAGRTVIKTRNRMQLQGELE